MNSLALVSAQGQSDTLALVSAKGQPDLRASQQSIGSATSDGNVASSAQLHKQLLAAEVAKVNCASVVCIHTKQNPYSSIG